jgi:hypothetical protein
MNPNARKTLMLGLISGMSLDQTKPFFLSLEKSGYHGDICLFVSGLDLSTQAFLRARKTNLVPFQKAYPKPIWAKLAGVSKRLLTRRQRLVFDEQLSSDYLHLFCARYAYYRQYLTECCGKNYDYVMLTDVRDVLFQNDPFDFEIPEGLSFFMEDPSQTIGTCPSNSNWMRLGFGTAVLKELADKPISCSGTVFGTTAAILNHVENMLRISLLKKWQRFFDQATHNFILYKQPPPALHCFRNDAGPVLTMAYVNPARLRFNDSGLLVNTAGRVFNTLHQYDRHPELARQLIQTLT